MTWQCYQLTYELLSPLHVGYHKVGNVQRTRYYLPSRNLWGAVTEALTRRSFSASGAPEGNYQKIGEWVQEHCAFTYFFVLEGEELFQPHYRENMLHYGKCSQAEFEQRYLDSHVTTALEAYSTSALTGSLHEVEFISPYPLDSGAERGRTRLQGWILVDDQAHALWSQIREALEDLRVGGERRYGFGRLRMVVDPVGEQPAGYVLSQSRPQITLTSGKPLSAHTLVDNVKARGLIEPLIGRETQNSARFGGQLTSAQICWVPGSLLLEDAILQVENGGYWAKVKGGYE